MLNQERMKEFEEVITEGLSAYKSSYLDTTTRLLTVLLNLAAILKLIVGTGTRVEHHLGSSSPNRHPKR